MKDPFILVAAIRTRSVIAIMTENWCLNADATRIIPRPSAFVIMTAPATTTATATSTATATLTLCGRASAMPIISDWGSGKDSAQAVACIMPIRPKLGFITSLNNNKRNLRNDDD